MNKCIHVSNNHNKQNDVQNKVSEQLSSIAYIFFQIIVLLPILHLFFLYKQK